MIAVPIVAVLLAGCASMPPAPVVERSLASGASMPREEAASADRTVAQTDAGYRVARGDTLYAIAFNHGLDYRDLAAWNHIDAPYRILVGQQLRLTRPAQSETDAATAPAAGAAMTAAAPDTAQAGVVTALSAVAPETERTATGPGKPGAPAGDEHSTVITTSPRPGSANSRATTPVPTVAKQETPGPITPSPRNATAADQPDSAGSSSPVPAASASGIATTSTRDTSTFNAGGVAWRWPGKGNLIGTFVAGDQTRQGIDLAGHAGDPVLAAADGEVVYSGNGLLGYGELIIVKHNASFLSAYGHNRMRQVQEGDRVKAGQQIGEMGSSGAARDELHFEIRKNGKPVNPLEFLPAR